MARSILFLDQYGDLGGGQRSLLALLTVAIEGGMKTAVLAPGGGLFESTVERVAGDKVEFHCLPEAGMTKGAKRLRDVLALFAFTLQVLASLGRRRCFNTRYFNGPHTFVAGLLASPFFAGRSIYHVRIDFSRLEKWIVWLIVRFGRNSIVVFNSAYLRETYSLFDPTSAESTRIIVVENCLYPPFSDLPFEDRFTGGNSRLKAAVFGRICPDKGQDRLVAAVRACPFLDVFLVGKCYAADCDYLDRILIEGGGRILHAGFTQDLPVFVSNERIQLSIVPSRWNEAFGLVAIESMAMSCLTFVSDRGMLPNIAGRTGASVFATDGELASLLQPLADASSGDLARLARAQHQRVMKEFSYRRFSSKIALLFAGDH